MTQKKNNSMFDEDAVFQPSDEYLNPLVAILSRGYGVIEAECNSVCEHDSKKNSKKFTRESMDIKGVSGDGASVVK